MVGIYKITNTKNNKVYIGKSTDIERRWKEHIRHSKDEFTKEKPAIHKAINKYGVNTFNSIWHGKSYKNIMPEVFTEDNRLAQRDWLLRIERQNIATKQRVLLCRFEL